MVRIFLIFFVTLFCCVALAAVHSDTHTYIVSPEEKKLLIIDRKTGKETILEFQYSPSYFTIYKNKGYLLFTFEIQVIDLETHSLRHKLQENYQLGPELVIHQDIGYVTKIAQNVKTLFIVLIDLQRDRVLKEIELSHFSFMMNIHGEFGYVAQSGRGLTIVDLKKQKVLKVLDIPQATEDMIIKGEIGYIVCGIEGCIAVINLKDQVVQGLIPVGYLAKTMVVQGDFGYIPCYHHGKFAIINLKTNVLCASVTLPEDPLLVKLYKNRAIVCCGVLSRKIYIVNLTSNTLEKVIEIGHLCDDIVLCGDKGFLRNKYSRENSIVIDLNTFEKNGQIPNPNRLEIEFDGERIYLGITALGSPYNKEIELFNSSFQGITGPLNGSADFAFSQFETFYLVGEMEKAEACFEEALSLCHPKAFAIAAYAFLYGKWGAKEDFYWVSQFFPAMDKTYYIQLCTKGSIPKKL